MEDFIMKNLPKVKIGIVAVSRDCFPESLSVNRRKALMEACQVGCIGCKLCEKNCPSGAVTVTNFLAHIDAEKCTNCGICAEKCPRKSIVS